MADIFFSGTDKQIIDGIKNQAGTDFSSKFPTNVTNDNAFLTLGNVLMDHVDARTMYGQMLVKLAYQIVESGNWKSPFSRYEREPMPYGGFVENTFIDLLDVYSYDVTKYNELYSRYNPNLRTAFHYLNTHRIYPVTIEDWMIRKSASSREGFLEIINKLIGQMVQSEYYDDFHLVKYMIAKLIVQATLPYKDLEEAYTEKDIAQNFRAISNQFTFRSRKNNIAGVRNLSLKENQDIMIDADLDAAIDVNVYSEAFHIDMAEMYARKLLIDNWTEFEYDRIKEILKDSETVTEFTDDELAVLSKVKALVFDRDFLMLIPGQKVVRQNENGLMNWTNHFYHVEKCYSINPFANATLILENRAYGNPTKITVVNSKVEAKKGNYLQIIAYASGEGVSDSSVYFKPQNIDSWVYSSDDRTWRGDGVSITDSGFIKFEKDHNTGYRINIISKENSSVSTSILVGDYPNTI